jgi:hypothetical protein
MKSSHPDTMITVWILLHVILDSMSYHILCRMKIRKLRIIHLKLIVFTKETYIQLFKPWMCWVVEENSLTFHNHLLINANLSFAKAAYAFGVGTYFHIGEVSS